MSWKRFKSVDDAVYSSTWEDAASKAGIMLNSYQLAAMNNVSSNISDLPSGVIQVDAWGPVMFAVLGKMSDVFYAGLLFGYGFASYHPSVFHLREQHAPVGSGDVRVTPIAGGC